MPKLTKIKLAFGWNVADVAKKNCFGRVQIEDADGGTHLYINGLLHGTPAIIDSYGSKYWYKHGKLHRKDGPAIEQYDGHYGWYINGTRFTNTDNVELLKRFPAYIIARYHPAEVTPMQIARSLLKKRNG